MPASGSRMALVPPVTRQTAITANTVYVGSYHTVAGQHKGDISSVARTGVDNPPPHASATGMSGSIRACSY